MIRITARRTALGVAILAASAVALTGVAPAQAAIATKATPLAQTTNSAQNQGVPRIAREWAAAWNSTDTTLLAKLFTDNAVYNDFALGQTLIGHDQITAWKVGTDERIADVHVTILNAFQIGDHVAMEMIYAGHANGAPNPFAVRLTTILDLDHGKISGDRDNYNLSTILSQSGLPPEAATSTGS
jgi:ketosteroid isomerase-like protein